MEPLQITPEQQLKIDEAAKHLPDGYQIFSTAQVLDLKAENTRTKYILAKLKPVLSLLKEIPEGVEVMQALPMLIPKAMPLLLPLKDDEEFKTKMAEAIAAI